MNLEHHAVPESDAGKKEDTGANLKELTMAETT